MKHVYTISLYLLLLFITADLLFAQGSKEQNIIEGTTESHILYSNPGPPNNLGGEGWAMFLDLIAGPSYVTITQMTTASAAAANATFTIEFFTRQGTALGGPVGSGPGSSSAGWTSLGTVTAVQGSQTNGISTLFNTPVITIAPGDTVGVAMVFTNIGPRYFGSGSPPLGVYSDAFLTLVTGDVRTIPFTASGGFYSSRELVGEIHYDDIIPVELTSFTSYVSENDVVLNWVTASELNNSGFSIERKTPSTDWINVGFVQGQGTITESHIYSFVDKDLKPELYNYRLKQIDFNGSYKYYDLSETVEVGLINNFYLAQNYPNPFNPETRIDYKIAEETIVNISLYDITGRMIRELVNERKQPGLYTLTLNGRELSSGTYFYKLATSSGYVSVKKLILLK